MMGINLALWLKNSSCRFAFKLQDALNAYAFTSSHGIESYLKEHGSFQMGWMN